MAVTINGTTGVAVPLGSASAPAETNTTSSTTGIYYPTSTTLGLSTNGTNAVYIDASQNVGIGTSTFNGVKTVIQGAQTGGVPQTSGTTQTYGVLRLKGTTFTSVLDFGTNGGTYNWIQATDSANLATNYDLAIQPNGGNLLVGTTTVGPGYNNSTTGSNISSDGTLYSSKTGNITTVVNNNTSGNQLVAYCYQGTIKGSVTLNGTTGVLYNVTSDYRLKENVQPMTTGLATVCALKPVTYDWIGVNEKGEGFIAHELQEVIPLAVTGEKDAVNENGSIKSQGVDYSKVVVHLVAAIQELSAEVEALKAKVGA